LAVGATVASCLIPELTIVGGIWGIPVLGFALLVAAIFRIAVYYDPREPQSPNAKKYAGYVAGSYLGYLAVFSCMGVILQRGQHIAASLVTIFGVLVLLSVLAFTDYVWVTKQTPEYPTVCQMRLFFLVNSSTLLVIAYFTGHEGFINVMKPFGIFFAYTNCVYFAAVFCGIFRSRMPYASNGTIAERFKYWARSITERIRGWLHLTILPGNLLVTIEAVFSLVFIVWMIIETGCEIPVKFRLIPKAIFTVIIAIAFYKACQHDPRKPPENVSLVIRVLTLFAHFAISVYLEVYVEFFRKGDDSATFTVHLISLALLIFLRATLIYWCLMKEFEITLLCDSRLFVIIFHISINTIASMCYIYTTMYNKKEDIFFAAQFFSNNWFYVTTLMIVSIIAGKHRPVVRLLPSENYDIIVV
jgi:hypothetical protein